MTDTFTIDDIKKAWANYWPSRVPKKRTISGLITELTRTQWKPYKPIHDEVYYTGGHYIKYREGDILSGNPRSLTPDEVPAWKRDKEALKVAIKVLKGTETIEAMGGLAKIYEITAANEDMK